MYFCDQHVINGFNSFRIWPICKQLQAPRPVSDFGLFVSNHTHANSVDLWRLGFSGPYKIGLTHTHPVVTMCDTA